MHGAYLHVLAGTGEHARLLSPLEVLALLTAAIGHDVEHPGVTNAFLSQTHAPLAVLYNDRSVLENHHAATTFHILSKPNSQFLGTLSEAQYRECRELIVATILATDMAHHKSMVTELSQHAAGQAPMPPVDVLRALCHLSDLGNVVLSWQFAKQWAAAIGAEIVSQSLVEQSLGFEPTSSTKLVPYTEEELAARQLVFIDDWVWPLYKVAAILFPGAKNRLAELERNREACKKVLQHDGAVNGHRRFSILSVQSSSNHVEDGS